MNKSQDFDPNIDVRIHEKILPNALAFKNGIIGEKASNPEIYLREFLNHSQYFRKLSKGEDYAAPESEAHGECDAISSAYEIDFKTLISSSMANAKKNTELQTEKCASGVTLTISSRSNRDYSGSYITRLLRGLSLDEIENKQYSSSEQEIGVKDLEKFLKVLLKHKNILLYLPASFSISGVEQGEDPVGILTHAFQHDLCSCLRYRSNHVPDKDTFFCTIYEKDFCIWKWGNGRLVFEEAVLLSASKTFMYLAGFV